MGNRIFKVGRIVGFWGCWGGEELGLNGKCSEKFFYISIWFESCDVSFIDCRRCFVC